MNYDLMQSHIDNSYHSDINIHLKEDNSNISAFFCPDVVGDKRFALNYGGYPRSEIAEINAAADLNQQMSLLSQLTDYSSDSNPNSGLSDADIMLGHRSKYCQTPSEQVRWFESQIHERDLKRAAVESPASEDTKINFDGNENTES